MGARWWLAKQKRSWLEGARQSLVDRRGEGERERQATRPVPNRRIRRHPSASHVRAFGTHPRATLAGVHFGRVVRAPASPQTRKNGIDKLSGMVRLARGALRPRSAAALRRASPSCAPPPRLWQGHSASHRCAGCQPLVGEGVGHTIVEGQASGHRRGVSRGRPPRGAQPQRCARRHRDRGGLWYRCRPPALALQGHGSASQASRGRTSHGFVGHWVAAVDMSCAPVTCFRFRRGKVTGGQGMRTAAARGSDIAMVHSVYRLCRLVRRGVVALARKGSSGRSAGDRTTPKFGRSGSSLRLACCHRRRCLRGRGRAGLEPIAGAARDLEGRRPRECRRRRR